MVFKELKEKYKDYSIIAFGKPLKIKTIPFTSLPKNKELDDCEIIEMKVIDKEFTEMSVDFKKMNGVKSKKMKGHIYVYVK